MDLPKPPRLLSTETVLILGEETTTRQSRYPYIGAVAASLSTGRPMW